VRTAGLVGLILLATACSGAQHPTDTGDRPPGPEGSGGGGEPGPPPTSSTTPEVSRAGLAHILGESPGHFFGLVEVEGVGDESGSRFQGWRIVSLPTDTPSWLDVRVRDVVTSVNGMGLERPEDAQRVYELLRVASEVRIDLLRDGEARVVRIPVVDESEAPPEPGPEPAPEAAPAPEAPPPG
jgi:hypothetical protein